MSAFAAMVLALGLLLICAPIADHAEDRCRYPMAFGALQLHWAWPAIYLVTVLVTVLSIAFLGLAATILLINEIP
jgi:integral membrane sensor domain MASE1